MYFSEHNSWGISSALQNLSKDHLKAKHYDEALKSSNELLVRSTSDKGKYILLELGFNSLFSRRIRTHFKYLLLFFCIGCSILFVKAQKIYSFGHQVNFKHYANEEGFFSSSIRNLMQDSKGRIWICCQDGLSVFDGHSFYNFSTKDGFDSYDVGSACEDNSGGIWLGTNEGIYLYKENKFVKMDTSGGFMPKRISWSLFTDADGTIWAGTANGLYHFDPTKPTKPLIKRYRLPGTESSNRIRLIKRKTDHKLIVGTEDGCFAYKPDTFYRVISTAGSGLFCHIELPGNKEWYSGFGSSILQYKNNVFDTIINIGSGILSMTKDNNNNIWLATWEKGLFKYNGKDLINYSKKEGLGYNSFWASLTDREGNVWFGSFGNGLYKYSGETFTSITEKNNLFGNNLNCIKPDKKGNVWLSSENSVSCYNPVLNTITNYTSCNNTPLSLIQSLIVTEKNEIYILRYSDYGYRITDGKIYTEPWLTGLAGVEAGKDEYFVTSESPMRKINKDRTSSVVGKKGIFKVIVDIYKDKENYWFMNAFTGLGFFNGTREHLFLSKHGFRNKPATCIDISKKGELWIGGRTNGVRKYKLISDTMMQIVDSISKINGLQSDNINSIHLYGSKMLIGTAYGLAVLDMDQYSKGNKIIKTYTAEDGLVNTNCTVAFIDSLGMAWIKTPKGAFIFDTNTNNFNSTETTTYIKNIELFFEEVNWPSLGFKTDMDGLPVNLKLPYDKNHLSFSFIGICQTAPSKVKYQYMLAGSDKSWWPVTTNNKAVYSNISAGTYTFMVRSCNNDGVWNKQPTHFIFTIDPPFWKTPWFYVVAFISIGAVFYSYTKWRERKLKKANDELERKITERTQQLKKAFLEIEEKNKDITDSINYAKRIQEAILPAKELKYKLFPNSFVLYQPKDVVSGDFYWFAESKGKRIIAAVDCTGHGVPGAFMSLIGSTILNELVNVQGITKPSEVLNKLRDQIIYSLKQSDGNNKDGMDITLLCFDDKKNTLEFAGANNPLWIIRNNECIEIKGDKQPVGYSGGEAKSFSNHKVDFNLGDTFYIFTDGYADQFGGIKGKKYKYSQLKEFLISTQSENINDQEQKLIEEFKNWRGNLEQVDDVCVIGVKF